MLRNKVILYDDSCPMCSMYTSVFVQMKLLEPGHRVGLSHANPAYLDKLDLQRARHEIPLLDCETGKVDYGIDALLIIFSHKYPRFRRLFYHKLVRPPLYALYQVITYNRRVIAGTAAPCNGFNCAPDFNLKYRALYLVISLGSWFALMVGLCARAATVNESMFLGAVFAIVTLQAIALLSCLRAPNRWDYGSNTATDLLVFGLLLIPTVLFRLPLLVVGANLVFAVAITTVDFGRRMRNLSQFNVSLR